MESKSQENRIEKQAFIQELKTHAYPSLNPCKRFMNHILDRKDMASTVLNPMHLQLRSPMSSIASYLALMKRVLTSPAMREDS